MPHSGTVFVLCASERYHEIVGNEVISGLKFVAVLPERIADGIGSGRKLEFRGMPGIDD